MKLYANDFEFEVKAVERITPKVKAEFITAYEKYTSDDTIEKKFEFITSQAKEEVSKKKKDSELTEAGVDLMQNIKLLQTFSPHEKTNIDAILNAYKVMINKKGLTEKQLELIDSDISGEFWQNQDIQAMRMEVVGFCGRLAI